MKIENISKILDVIHFQPRYFFGMSILGLFFLFAPIKVLEIFDVSNFVKDYRSIVGFTTLFSIFFFVIKLIPIFKNILSKYLFKKQKLKYLESLSREEALTLDYCIENNQKTLL